MGCDIHCYREKLIDGAWVSQQPMEPGEVWNDETREYEDGPLVAVKTYVPRNYGLFGLLSKGVRTKWDESFEAKGVPDDMSATLQAQDVSWKDDGHSHSWLTLEEIKTKQLILMVSSDVDAHDAGQALASFVKTIFDPSDDPATTRVVFWFDN